ncbi:MULTISPECIES: DUF4267 domain-containing protein [Olivibacter]|uniref:DUF4267 domain-containing protein n=1 Tax=Olivibacter oleidegradans TaxID=760123 RepID=A0ABV6HQG3_9SPHI|nr:DUF4267 domain-containing protein [Olivibacter sp. LS-1]QEL02910.1 DUF4267 domain-containing protein [Olivibacter sp. LS-1]
MQRLTKQINWWLCLLSGIGLLFIGARFFFHPVGAEIAFGINTPTNGDFSFHHIKGVRDFFFGFIILLLLLKKDFRILGYILLAGTIIPASDFITVLSYQGRITGYLYAHLIAAIICAGCGLYYSLSAAQH